MLAFQLLFCFSVAYQRAPLAPHRDWQSVPFYSLSRPRFKPHDALLKVDLVPSEVFYLWYSPSCFVAKGGKALLSNRARDISRLNSLHGRRTPCVRCFIQHRNITNFVNPQRCLPCPYLQHFFQCCQFSVDHGVRWAFVKSTVNVDLNLGSGDLRLNSSVIDSKARVIRQSLSLKPKSKRQPQRQLRRKSIIWLN